MGRSRIDDQSRSDFCVLGPNDFDCGTARAYQRDGCSDGPCLKAWRSYCDARKESRAFEGRRRKVYQNEHGTIECYAEGCGCTFCEKAFRWYLLLQDAEDTVLADVPGCLSWKALRRRSRRHRNIFRGHGERGRYRAGCRCRLCKLSNTIQRAKQRGSATWLQHEFTSARIRDRLNQEVNKILASQPWAGFMVEDYLRLPEECAERNKAERLAADRGETHLVSYDVATPRRHVIDVGNRWDKEKREA